MGFLRPQPWFAQTRPEAFPIFKHIVLDPQSEAGITNVASYNTSEFKKGIKVQIDGDPYLMIECNFVKPGKGNALYKCKLKHLIRNTVLDRTYKGGDSLEAADVSEIDAQFLYRQGEQFVFMDNASYEQYELTADQVDDAWKWIKEGTVCSMMLFNNRPISVEPPNHMVLKVEYCEPAVRGNTATNLTKPVKLETGAEILCPAFVNIGDLVKVDTRTGEYLERAKE
jgi:elongation factor P